jgi:hypothetical protein
VNAPSRPTTQDTLDRPIFVIASDNTAVHVYGDIQGVLGIDNVCGGGHDSIDFFDIRGHGLAPVFSRSGTLSGLRDVGDQPDAQSVQTRLCAVIRHLRISIDQRLAQAGNSAATREQALTQLPNLEGRSLEECFALLELAFGHADGRYGGDGPKRRDDGSWWHNFWCH